MTGPSSSVLEALQKPLSHLLFLREGRVRPPWQHPDPAHLTPALHKQGGDMKLAMLTLMGKAGLEGLFL